MDATKHDVKMTIKRMNSSLSLSPFCVKRYVTLPASRSGGQSVSQSERGSMLYTDQIISYLWITYHNVYYITTKAHGIISPTVVYKNN